MSGDVVPAAAAAEAEAAVAAAYNRMRPFFSNLLDDLGATDCFALDGDSLLLELLGGERLDWAHGGQFLQLRAALETLLGGIARANSASLRSYAVFFDASASVQPGAAAAAARALLAAWLPQLGVPVLRFPAWWSDEWRAWLARTRPAMLLLTDLPQGGGGDGAVGAADAAAEFERRRCFLRAQVVHSMAQGLTVAFMSELRFPGAARCGSGPGTAVREVAEPRQGPVAAALPDATQPLLHLPPSCPPWHQRATCLVSAAAGAAPPTAPAPQRRRPVQWAKRSRAAVQQ